MPRVAYQEELERLRNAVREELDAVVDQLALVLDVLPGRDRRIADEIIRSDRDVDRRYAAIQTDLVAVIARQAPVAGDLRLVTALLHISRMVERMGDQCVNIAKLVTVAGPPPPGTEQLAACVVDMGEAALDAVRMAADALRAGDPALADALEAGDARVNELNRSCFNQAIELGADERARAWATGMILVARAFERIGDNAVDIGAHMRFAATGAFESRGAVAG